jgi:hypothetical protein
VLIVAMVEFCMALLRALERGGALTDGAFCALSRAARFGLNLSEQTSHLLDQLYRGVFPTPKAKRRRAAPSESAELVEDLETRESAERLDDREPREFDNDATFLARFEDFEAAVDPDWSPLQAARTLCRVLRLKPDWLAALDEGWLDENLDLKRLLAEARAEHLPPLPPLLGRVDREAGRVGDAAPPHPSLRDTFPIKGKEERVNLKCDGKRTAPRATLRPLAAFNTWNSLAGMASMRSILLFFLGIPLPIILLLALCTHHF